MMDLCVAFFIVTGTVFFFALNVAIGIVRWNHGGKVCSGDYSQVGDQMKTSGEFMKFYVIINHLLIIVPFVMILVLAIRKKIQRMK